MSRSFKTEAARKTAHQRREARHSKIEWRDNFSECAQAEALCKKPVVDARPAYPRRWTPPGRA